MGLHKANSKYSKMLIIGINNMQSGYLYFPVQRDYGIISPKIKIQKVETKMAIDDGKMASRKIGSDSITIAFVNKIVESKRWWSFNNFYNLIAFCYSL